MTDIKTALKPCPLCGGEAHVCSPQVAEDEVHTYVECNSCDLKSGGIEAPYSEPEYAIAEWNTRVLDASAPAVMDTKQIDYPAELARLVALNDKLRANERRLIDELCAVQVDAPDANSKRYEYLLHCEFIAARMYIKNLDEVQFKEKLRARHDAQLQAIQSPQDQVKP